MKADYKIQYLNGSLLTLLYRESRESYSRVNFA